MPEQQMNIHMVVTREQARQLLTGAGADVARWVHPNHCEEWSEERDRQVRERSKETAKQFPGFAERMTHDVQRASQAAH